MAEEQNQATLTMIADGAPVPFTVNGVPFAIRQPEPEEYDQARQIYDLAYAKRISDPDVVELKDKPCSDHRKATLIAVAEVAEEAAAMPGVAEGQKKQLLERAQSLRETAETQTYAKELAHDTALLARDRWLTIRLLLDGQGNQVFDANAPDFRKRWAAKGMLKVKEEARPVIWQVMDAVESAPFSLDSLPGPSTG